MRAGGNPRLLRLAGADGTDEVVPKTGDVTAGLDRRQLITAVAALELAAGRPRPAPRLIAAGLDGGAAGTMAVLMTGLPGSGQIPRVAPAARLRALGAGAGAPRRHRGYRPAPWMTGTSPAGAGQPARRSCRPWPKSRSPDRELLFAHGDPWLGAMPSGPAILPAA